MLPVKKIYVDSRNRTPDSVSASNFKIQLPYSIQLPDNCVFFITDVVIPNIFPLITTDTNDSLYFVVWDNVAGAIPATYFNITIPSGAYTAGSDTGSLAAALQILLNGTDMQAANVSFSVSWSITTRSITISCNKYFKFFTDDELSVSGMNTLFKTSFNLSNPNTANDVFNIDTPMKPTKSYNTGFISFQPFNNIYLTSPNFGSFDTIASFSNNVIKKIPISVPYGYLIIDQNSTNNDFLNCSRQTIRTIEFGVKNSRGQYLDLQNMNISFSIIFNKYNIDQ